MSFDSLKKNRTSSLEKLNAQLTKMTSKSYADPNEHKFWKPTRDKAGNGFAIIRFLPPVAGEDIPFIQIWEHSFQGPTGLWYINKSLTSINQPDPVSELNSKLWNSNKDDESPERKQARKQKRKLKYVSNIYVIKDSGNPENEGKVFLYAYGKKIFDKLKDLMNPQYEDEVAVDPFNFWEGANFRLKVRQFEGYPNYDKSEFDSPEPLFDDDDKLEEIWKQQHSLKELHDPKQFKTYDELKAQLYRVLAVSEAPMSNSALDETDEDLDMSVLGKTSEQSEMKTVNNSISNDDDDIDELELFKELARGA
jgi:hypothetical protein